MPFTKENAAEMARLSHLPTSARNMPQDDDGIAENTGVSARNETQSDADAFRSKTVARVREHIERIQERIDKLLDKRSFDTKEMKELADTLKSLEVIEQKLSNRPAPAAAKVSSKPSRRSTEFPSPTPIAE